MGACRGGLRHTWQQSHRRIASLTSFWWLEIWQVRVQLTVSSTQVQPRTRAVHCADANSTKRVTCTGHFPRTFPFVSSMNVAGLGRTRTFALKKKLSGLVAWLGPTWDAHRVRCQAHAARSCCETREVKEGATVWLYLNRSRSQGNVPSYSVSPLANFRYFICFFICCGWSRMMQ